MVIRQAEWTEQHQGNTSNHSMGLPTRVHLSSQKVAMERGKEE